MPETTRCCTRTRTASNIKSAMPTARICAKDQLSDDQFDSERRAGRASGEKFDNGTMYHTDANGDRVNDGTYRQTDRDLEPMGASVIGGLAARADASMKFVGVVASGSVVVGATGGVIAAYAPELLGTGAAATAESSSVESEVGVGLRQQINLHKQKLADYIRNPDAFDNKGFLKNASPELRQKIIEGRIRNLEGQIEKFLKAIGERG